METLPPKMPPRPSVGESPGSLSSSGKTLGGTLFALLGAGVASVILLFGTFLILMPLGYLSIAIFLGLGALPLALGVHYFIWGRWIQNVLQRERDRETELERPFDGENRDKGA
jgi:hypothetical protein